MTKLGKDQKALATIFKKLWRDMPDDVAKKLVDAFDERMLVLAVANAPDVRKFNEVPTSVVRETRQYFQDPIFAKAYPAVNALVAGTRAPTTQFTLSMEPSREKVPWLRAFGTQ